MLSVIRAGLLFIALESIPVILLVYLLVNDLVAGLVNRLELFPYILYSLPMVVFQALLIGSIDALLGFGDTLTPLHRTPYSTIKLAHEFIPSYRIVNHRGPAGI